MTIRIRSFQSKDAPALRELACRAVREGTGRFYSAAEREAWAGRLGSAAHVWQEKLATQTTLVASWDDRMAGFMTLGHDGHLDFAYVHPDAMGRGVADALHDRVLCEAREAGLTLLTTDASLRAQRFFQRMGWHVVRHQQVPIGAQVLRNARMEKRL